MDDQTLDGSEQRVIALRAAVGLVTEIADNKERTARAKADNVVEEAEVFLTFLKGENDVPVESTENTDTIEDAEGVTENTPEGVTENTPEEVTDTPEEVTENTPTVDEAKE